MVEGELDPLLEDVGDGYERCVGRVRAGGDRSHVAQHGEVGDRHDVHARVARGIAVGAELRQEAGDVDARLLGELAPLAASSSVSSGRLKPPGIAHMPLKGVLASSYEEGVQDALGHRQDDDVHRDGEGREFPRVVPGRVFARGVIVGMTLTVARRFWSCQP